MRLVRQVCNTKEVRTASHSGGTPPPAPKPNKDTHSIQITNLQYHPQSQLERIQNTHRYVCQSVNLASEPELIIEQYELPHPSVTTVTTPVWSHSDLHPIFRIQLGVRGSPISWAGIATLHVDLTFKTGTKLAATRTSDCWMRHQEKRSKWIEEIGRYLCPLRRGRCSPS